MNIHKALVNARNYIDKHGWVQFELANIDGRVCAGGGIMRGNNLSGVLDSEYKFEAQIAEALVRHIPADFDPRKAKYDKKDYAIQYFSDTDWGRMVCWNNESGRTKEDILNLFDAAIKETAPDPDVSFLDNASYVERQRENSTLVSTG